MTERSRAAVALMRSEMSQTEVARAVGVSAVSVHHWLQCVKKPSQDKRERISSLSESWDCGRIEPAWWDDIPDRELPSTPPESAPPLPNDLPGQLQYLERRASILAHAIDSASTPEKQIRALAHLTRVLRDIADIRTKERKSFRENPMWRAFVGALAEALKPFPEAAEAVRERFGRLDLDG